MGAGASLPDARVELAARRETASLRLVGGAAESACAVAALGETAEADGTPRTASQRLNATMSEALRRQDLPTCASVGSQLAELRGVRWLESSDNENLSGTDKPCRAVLAAVCAAKAVEVQRSHQEQEYFLKVGAMFAASLGPQGVGSKATVAAARSAQTMSAWKTCGSPAVRFAEPSEHRRSSTSF